VVFYERYGKSFVRSAPTFKKKRTFTPNQIVAKKKFSKANRMARRLKYIAEFTYAEQKGVGSPYHKMLGQINKYAIKGENPEELAIIPELLPLAWGSIPPEAQMNVNSQENVLTISWTADVGNRSDEFVVASVQMMEYSKNKQPDLPFEDLIDEVKLIDTNATRADKAFQIQLDGASFNR